MLKKIIDRIKGVKIIEISHDEALNLFLKGQPIYKKSNAFIGVSDLYEAYLKKDDKIYWFFWCEKRKQYDCFSESSLKINSFVNSKIKDGKWHARKSNSNNLEKVKFN
ncbi:MAG: hypothetical protein E7H33_09465 [Clostridium perfringens]|nr:hypothetical protein [Clostridium perfringens]